MRTNSKRRWRIWLGLAVALAATSKQTWAAPLDFEHATLDETVAWLAKEVVAQGIPHESAAIRKAYTAVKLQRLTLVVESDIDTKGLNDTVLSCHVTMEIPLDRMELRVAGFHSTNNPVYSVYVRPLDHARVIRFTRNYPGKPLQVYDGSGWDVKFDNAQAADETGLALRRIIALAHEIAARPASAPASRESALAPPAQTNTNIAPPLDFEKATLDETVAWLKGALCKSASEHTQGGEVANYINVERDGRTLRIVNEQVTMVTGYRVTLRCMHDCPLDQLSTERILLEDESDHGLSIYFRVADKTKKIKETNLNDMTGSKATERYTDGFIVSFHQNKDVARNAAKALKRVIELAGR